MKIGIIGCGSISNAYFEGGKKASNLEVVACADLNPDAAIAKAAEHGCNACSVEQLLRIPDLELVVNLTIPKAHVSVALQAIEAGKHVYSEKPLAIDLDEGKTLLEAATRKGLRVGNAPDTFLFGHAQSSRKAIDEGEIGHPIAGIATMMCHGHEHWHPNPSFYYEQGGGPMMDMGPYYLHTLVNLLGPIKSVTGYAKQTFQSRLASSEGAKGKSISVSVPTHYAGTLEFLSGALVTIVMSFDVWRSQCPPLQIFGTEGSLIVGDPNTFSEAPLIQRERDDWQSIALLHAPNARMIGVVDMVQAIQSNRPHRADGQNALHVLEVMLAFEESSRQQRQIPIETPALQPAALPTGLTEWSIDE